MIDKKEKMLKFCAIAVPVTAITELALSQLSIKITRLSAAELTGISFFAFIIFGLVTVFAVSRIKDSVRARFFAVIMNITTALSALWYLRLLFSDEIFFRNLYYSLNRQTQVYEPLALGARIVASIPLALIVLGTAVYLLCAISILIASLAALRKKPA